MPQVYIYFTSLVLAGEAGREQDRAAGQVGGLHHGLSWLRPLTQLLPVRCHVSRVTCPHDRHVSRVRNQSQCEATLAGSECQLSTGTCHCAPPRPLSVQLRRGGRGCVAGAGLGADCEDDLQCRHEDNSTRCHHGRCGCQPGHVSTQSGTCIQGSLSIVIYSSLMFPSLTGHSLEG